MLNMNRVYSMNISWTLSTLDTKGHQIISETNILVRRKVVGEILNVCSSIGVFIFFFGYVCVFSVFQHVIAVSLWKWKKTRLTNSFFYEYSIFFLIIECKYVWIAEYVKPSLIDSLEINSKESLISRPQYLHSCYCISTVFILLKFAFIQITKQCKWGQIHKNSTIFASSYISLLFFTITTNFKNSLSRKLHIKFHYSNINSILNG